jgi:hypothetical protein
MENQEQAQVGAQEGAPAAPELNITDLANLRSVVEVATRRGAFAANEMSAVGATYDKINAFLNAAMPPKTDEQPAAAE